MLIARSTAALRVIGWLKFKMIGMPTPYCCLKPSMVEAWKVALGLSVLNELVTVAVFPSAPIAVAVTV